MKKIMFDTKKLFQFIDESPSSFHVISNLEKELQSKGFQELKEEDSFQIKPEGKYYITRNGSSIIAFKMPTQIPQGFHMTSSHSDSPSFKIKEKPEMMVENAYNKLNVERYGGMILSTWFDRPLSVAGRLVIEENGRITSKLVNIDQDLLLIPNVAIHMTKDGKKDAELNPQVDLIPLFGGKDSQNKFLPMIAKQAGVTAEDILGYDLFLYNRQKGMQIGAEGEFICSPRLDDLQCVYTTLQGFLMAEKIEKIAVYCVFDNEEVGSMTKQGAESTFLYDVLQEICQNYQVNGSYPLRDQYRKLIKNSFMLSADNAHGIHPNHPELADPTNRPVLNGGVVIKYHGGQKYTTDAVSGGIVKSLMKKNQLAIQTYQNRSDMAGGSTLGNISTTQVSVTTADVGLPQLSMHSALETAGEKDSRDMVILSKALYEMK